MKKVLKGLFICILIICVFVLIKLFFKISTNNTFIENYPLKEQEYRLKSNTFLNLYEPYVVYYNYGNYFFKKEKYDEAYEKYLEALKYDMPSNIYCKTNMNIALTLYKKTEGLNAINKKKLLEEAESYLQNCLNINMNKKIDISFILLIAIIVIGISLTALILFLKSRMGIISSLNIFYIKKLEEMKTKFMNGNLSSQEVYSDLSDIISEFVEKNLKINVFNFRKDEINKLGINDLTLLMEEYHSERFSMDDDTTLKSINKTMEVIKKWSWK